MVRNITDDSDESTPEPLQSTFNTRAKEPGPNWRPLRHKFVKNISRFGKDLPAQPVFQSTHKGSIHVPRLL